VNLVRSAATVGGFTLISRVLGFIRDVLTAALVGTGPVADAFFVAQRFPNLFRSLFAEGAFASAFVPLFAKKLEADGKDRARQFAEQALGVLLAALLIFTMLAQIAMPWAMTLIAPGFQEDPAKYDLAVLFCQITFPYLIFMALTALYGGILNSMSKFWAAAAAPIMLNLVLIFVLLLIAPHTPTPGHALSWGVTVSGVLQFLWMVYAARSAGMNLSLPRPRLTPEVKRLLVLTVPGTIAAGVSQINILVGSMIASFSASAVSYLYYADRVYQLPLGVIGIAVGAVLLPDLSRKLAAGDDQGAQLSQSRATRITMLLTMPATMALVVIPFEIVVVLFERGAFDRAASLETAKALVAFALGLPAYVLVKVFTPAFFARENTKTPLRFAAVSVSVNIAGSAILFPVMGHVGIALATALAAWVNVAQLVLRLSALNHFHLDSPLVRGLARIGIASLIMGGVLLLGAKFMAGAFLGPVLPAALALAGLVAGGMAVYGVAVLATGAVSLSEIKALARR